MRSPRTLPLGPNDSQRGPDLRPYAVGRVARSCRYCRWYNIVRVSVIRSVERSAAFASRKSKSKTEIAASSVPGWTQRFALFGRPLLIEGEDAAAYDQLLARICSVVKPLDIIEEIFIADLVFLEWEVLRWRRLKSILIQARGREALQRFLIEQFESNCALHDEYVEDYVAEILKNKLPEHKAHAERLATECARNDPRVVNKLNSVLDGFGLDSETILDEARADKAKELVQDYVRREPNAVTLVDELLTNAGISIDALTIDGLCENFDHIERIDRLITIAESRRNASLHEIDRHRATLGGALRRSMQEVEDAEFKVIETTPTKGKNAA